MMNPINPSSLALPADLSNAELPSTIARAAAPVAPSAQTAKLGTTTSYSPQPDQNPTGDTPLDKTLEQLNESMRAWSTGMRFDVDEDAQRVVVSIVDSATGEVLRTVPSDAVIRVAKMIVQLQGGAIDTRA